MGRSGWVLPTIAGWWIRESKARCACVSGGWPGMRGGGTGRMRDARADDPAEACRCALRAEENLRARMTELNERRLAGEPGVFAPEPAEREGCRRAEDAERDPPGRQLGVEGDAHYGVTVKHRSRARQNPDLPNLRQDRISGCPTHKQ